MIDPLVKRINDLDEQAAVASLWRALVVRPLEVPQLAATQAWRSRELIPTGLAHLFSPHKVHAKRNPDHDVEDFNRIHLPIPPIVTSDSKLVSIWHSF